MSKHTERYLCGLIFLVVFFYLTLRTLLISITIDEAASSFPSCNLSFFETIYFTFKDANFHLLNCILIYLLTHLFGVSQFIVRLPNLIAFCIYAFFGYRLLRLLSADVVFIVSGFIILCSNTYLLDFFSLARGYGLSIGFMMGSLYYLMKFNEGLAKKYLNSTFLFCMLAIASSYVMLNFLMVLLTCIVWIVIKNKFKNITSILIISFGHLVLMGLIFYVPIHELQSIHAFYYGGNRDIWNDTIETLAFNLIKGESVLDTRIESLKIILTAIISTTMIVSMVINYYKKLHAGFLLIIANTLLILPFFSVIIQHQFLGTLFLINRTALFLFPLAIVALLINFKVLLEWKNSQRYSQLLLIMAALFFAVSSFLTFNLNHTHDWRQDADNKGVVSDLKQYLKANNIKGITNLYIDKSNHYGLEFYKQYNPDKWLYLIMKEDSLGDQKFYYLPKEKPKDSPIECYNDFDKTKFEIIKSYPISGNILFKRIGD